MIKRLLYPILLFLVFTSCYTSEGDICNGEKKRNTKKSFSAIEESKELKKIFQQRDSSEVYLVFHLVLGDTINPNNIPGYDFSISKEEQKSLLDRVLNHENKKDVLDMVWYYFAMDNTLNLPFFNDYDEPFYFEEIISQEPELNKILVDLLNSPDRSWSSLSTNESIVLRYRVVMYLISIKPAKSFSILENYFEICKQRAE